MSLNKIIGGRSWQDRKEIQRQESYQEEILTALRSQFVSREMGIYSHQRVVELLRQKSAELSKLPELKFIDELKKINADVGIYLVGGAVRDAILGKKSKDVDLVINN
ncbi:hypothetical protein D6821_01180, partial [Candidatus Parcubacteria bacterium]